MIVCHRHRFIFLKTPKTAGTSIEIALSAFCGDGDIITPISPADEVVRKSSGYPGPQNYFYPLSAYRKVDLLRLFLKGRVRKAFNHMGAREARDLLGSEVWSGYFKFAVERNPWDKVVSRYFWDYQDESQRPSFDRYIAEGPMHKAAAFDQYSIDGRIAVDHVIRYEDLRSEIQLLARRLNLGAVRELPRTKSGTRVARAPYQEMYGQEAKRQVAVMFAREIAAFGYEF